MEEILIRVEILGSWWPLGKGPEELAIREHFVKRVDMK